MSTDPAFLIGCLAVLGFRIPQSLRVFLLSLVIFDDIGAILVIAFGYAGDLNWGALTPAGLEVAVVVGIAVLGIQGVPSYFAVGGLVLLAIDTSGIPPTIPTLSGSMFAPGAARFCWRWRQCYCSRCCSFRCDGCKDV